MIQQIIHVYLMPGMAANSRIFEHIELPENTFKVHLLEWLMPFDDESLSSYALRMTKNIKHDHIVLLGVSFGGVLVQEMSKYISVKKLIIVASIKSKYELPKKMRLAKSTGLYKMMPTKLASKLGFFEKYVFGKKLIKKVEHYKKYLSVNDSKYLDWAIKEMVCWDQEEYRSDLIHIHGDNDPIFPIEYISNCITIPKGSHIIIINKYKWFNTNLPLIILAE